MSSYLLAWTQEAWESYLYWQKHDKKMLKHINMLIKDTLRDPYNGLGEPEALKANLSFLLSKNRYRT